MFVCGGRGFTINFNAPCPLCCSLSTFVMHTSLPPFCRVDSDLRESREKLNFRCHEFCHRNYCTWQRPSLTFQAYWLRDPPTGLTFNNCRLCPHCIYVFCIYLRTNSDLYYLQHKLIGFYNRDKKCLQRGTDWVFK